VATAIPLVGFGIVVSVLLVEHDQANFVKAVQDRNRAFMTAVDSQLKGYVDVLQSLAASDSLRNDDLATFHDHLGRVLATQRDWLTVLLLAPDGRHLVNPQVPLGQPLQRTLQQPGSFERVVHELRPAVGGVIEHGTITGRTGIPVRIPYLRDGRLVYVLTAIVKPEAFERLMHEQQLPSSWVSGLVDARGRFIARVPPMPVGSMASQAFLDHARASDEGWYRGLTVESRDTFTAHARSPFTGWMIGFALPASVVLAGSHHAALLIGLGICFSLLSALAVGFWLMRRITRPIAVLAAAAPSLGSEAALPSFDARIDEVRELGRALGEASRAIRERRQGIEREREALRASDRAKEEFLAMLSHELRNPMGAMVTANHVLMASRPGSESFTKAQQVMQRQMMHMTRMVEDLLDVSRLAMGRVSFTFEAFDLAELASTVAETWRETGRLAQHALSLSLQSVRVRADRARMEQVIANLLDNAAKFTPPGRAIAVETRAEDGHAVLVVADEGRGIAAAELARIFDPFVQGEQEASRPHGGMGLGLALVRRLVEMQGGAVHAESEGPGRGARLVVRLPVCRDADPRPPTQRRPAASITNETIAAPPPS
jgi:signal transduction histidine kinase